MKQYCAYLLGLLLIFAQISNQSEFSNELNSSAYSLFLNESENELETLERSFSENKGEEQSYFSSRLKPKKITKTIEKSYDPDLVLQNDENLNPVMSDWLKISSPQFKNTQKFPLIELENGKQITINLDNGYYRINEFYDKNDKNGPPSNLFFWFRLSGRNLYYSLNKVDMNVIGSIYIKDIQDITPLKGYSKEPTCMEIIDTNNSKWKICTENTKIKAKWVCGIKKNIGKEEPDCEKILIEADETTVLTKMVTKPIILIPLTQRMCNNDWQYSKNGNDWECECKEGKQQSPIDLPTQENSKISPVKPIFQYEEVQAQNTIVNELGKVSSNQNLKLVLQNGILKIKYKNFGKIVTLDGSVYAAEEIIFHTPAEHKIGGKNFEMEMQIIHVGQTKGDIAKHIVLSFLFERKPGVYNKFLDDLDVFNLPNANAEEREIFNNLYIPKILYNSDNDDIPVMKPFSFYTYQGSLTSPPCIENTIHYVAAKPIPVGHMILELFKEATRLPDKIDANGNVIINTTVSVNNRNIQPLNGRTVYFFNHEEFCGPDPPERPKPKPNGHYEKVNKKITEYFFVNSDKPSGLPGAYVVTEEEAKGQ